MSKIVRPSEIINFAEDYQTNEMTEYGTIDAPALDNLALMANAEYYRGWGINDPVTDPNPYIQDFNAMAYTISLFNGYVYQEGVVDYTSSQTYYLDSITKFNRELWISDIDNNKGNQPGNGGGSASFQLLAFDPENIENREKLVHMGGSYMVRYKTAGTNEFQLIEVLGDGNYNFVGTTPITLSVPVMSKMDRLTDTKFVFSQGDNPNLPASLRNKIFVYEVDLNTGSFVEVAQQSFNAGFQYEVCVLPSFDGNIRFIAGRTGDDVKIFEFDDSLNTITDVTFAFTLPPAFKDGCITNETNGEFAIFLTNSEGGSWTGAKIFGFDVSGFSDLGGDSTSSYSTATLLRQLEDDAYLAYTSGSGVDRIAVIYVDSNKNNNELQVFDAGPQSGNINKGYDALSSDRIIVLDSVADQIDTYGGSVSLGGWRKQTADELGFEGDEYGMESDNVQDAIAEALDKILPVGKIVHFYTDLDANVVYPVGTWQEIEGEFVVGIDESNPLFDTIGAQGGSENFTAPRDGWGSQTYGSNPTTEGRILSGSGAAEQTETWQSLGEAQNDQQIQKLPPYRVVRSWVRIN